MTDELYTWIVPDVLMASRRAQTYDDLDQWSRAGVRLVINLDTAPDDHAALGARGIRYRHFPIADFTAPEISVLVDAIRGIGNEINNGGSVCVHCRAGLGRTGTIVASWLVHEGFGADEAIAHVRALRPGSVETTDQENVVRGYADSLRSPADSDD